MNSLLSIVSRHRQVVLLIRSCNWIELNSAMCAIWRPTCLADWQHVWGPFMTRSTNLLIIIIIWLSWNDLYIHTYKHKSFLYSAYKFNTVTMRFESLRTFPYIVCVSLTGSRLAQQQTCHGRPGEIPAAGTQLPQSRPAPVCHRTPQIHSAIEVSSGFRHMFEWDDECEIVILKTISD